MGDCCSKMKKSTSLESINNINNHNLSINNKHNNFNTIANISNDDKNDINKRNSGEINPNPNTKPQKSESTDSLINNNNLK